MIKGLRIRISSGELKEHMLARSAYHKSRADEKETVVLPDVIKAREALETIGAAKSVANMSKGGYNFDPKDQIDDLKQDIENHRNRSFMYEWLANHLFDDEYDLEETDLRRIEILK